MAKTGGGGTGSAGKSVGIVGQALGPAAKDFGKEIQPLGSELGNVTLRTVRALLRPVTGLVWGFEQVEGWISESLAPRLQRVPEEHRIEPKLLIAGPTIDSMKYCGAEPHLRDLFANLLCTSMDARRAATAHPAFVEIVRQISPDEAKLLKYMATRFHESYRVIVIYRTWEALRDNTTVGATESRTAKVFGPYSVAARYAGCEHLRLVPTYITNLVRLQIINLEREHLSRKPGDEFEDDPLVQEITKEIQGFRYREGVPADRATYEAGFMEMTPLGHQFQDACVRPLSR